MKKLNEAVAKHVMGYTPSPTGNWDTGRRSIEGDILWTKELPNYASTMFGANLVIDKLHELGYKISVHSKPRKPSGLAYVEGVEEGYTYSEFFVEDDHPLPEGICLLALSFVLNIPKEVLQETYLQAV